MPRFLASATASASFSKGPSRTITMSPPDIGSSLSMYHMSMSPNQKAMS